MKHKCLANLRNSSLPLVHCLLLLLDSLAAYYLRFEAPDMDITRNVFDTNP